MSSKRSKSRSTKKKKSPKTRKLPKFMSLKAQLISPPPEAQPATEPPPAAVAAEADNDLQFACLLHQETEPTTKISDIFGSSASSASSFGEVPSPASSSVVDLEEEDLARRALKGRERWVFCEYEEKEGRRMRKKNEGLLKLKLDYEEVWSAWSDKGSVFIDGDGPQVVPELMKGWYEDDSVVPSNVLVEVGNTSAWAVPEMEEDGKEKILEGDNKMKREERVMRYKAKRQSRLFAKRIRYEVRKLNAEKRPRIKGRFVKRVDDM